MRTIRETQYIRALQSKDETALEDIIRQYAGYVGTIVRNIIGKAMTNREMEENEKTAILLLRSHIDTCRTIEIQGRYSSAAP